MSRERNAARSAWVALLVAVVLFVPGAVRAQGTPARGAAQGTSAGTASTPKRGGAEPAPESQPGTPAAGGAATAGATRDYLAEVRSAYTPENRAYWTTNIALDL